MTSDDVASAIRVLTALKVDTDCPFYQRLFAFIDVDSTTCVGSSEEQSGVSPSRSNGTRVEPTSTLSARSSWDMWNRISASAFADAPSSLVAGLLMQILDTLTWAHYSVLSKSVNFVSLGMHLVLHVPSKEFRTLSKLDARCRVVADPSGNVKTLEGCLFGETTAGAGQGSANGRIRLATMTQNVAVFPSSRTSEGMNRLRSKM